jgi:hypothetical protein
MKPAWRPQKAARYHQLKRTSDSAPIVEIGRQIAHFLFRHQPELRLSVCLAGRRP